MNCKRFLLIILLIFPFLNVKIYSQPHKKYDSYILQGSEIRKLKSKLTGRDFELIINLPYSYNDSTKKKYPVVYFCDGFYDFALMYSIYGQQRYDKTINECIMVGFSYGGKNPIYDQIRRFDYSPTKVPNDTSGNAKVFLEVVEKEFIPFVEKNYRVDPSFRALGGSSLGGLFALFTMFTKPELFNAYMAISPAVEWDNGWLFNYEEQFHKTRDELHVSLWMTGAEKEFQDHDPGYLDNIKKFNEVLGSRQYKNMRYGFRLIDNAYHSGTKPEGYARGMLFIFEPILQK